MRGRLFGGDVYKYESTVAVSGSSVFSCASYFAELSNQSKHGQNNNPG